MRTRPVIVIIVPKVREDILLIPAKRVSTLKHRTGYTRTKEKALAVVAERLKM